MIDYLKVPLTIEEEEKDLGRERRKGGVCGKISVIHTYFLKCKKVICRHIFEQRNIITINTYL